MSRILGGLCTLFLIVVFTPALIRADPIVVTSGNIMVSGLAGGPVFNLSGNNFSATSLGGDSGNFDLGDVVLPASPERPSAWAGRSWVYNSVVEALPT